MPRPKSKAIDEPWFKLLEEEREARKKAVFTEQHRTIAQLQQLRKMADLPSGRPATYAWVRKLKEANRIKQDDGSEVRHGKQVRVTKYLFI